MTDDDCPRCKGTGDDPQQYAGRSTSNHGHEDKAPCTECGGTGERNYAAVEADHDA